MNLGCLKNFKARKYYSDESQCEIFILNKTEQFWKTDSQ